MKRFLGRLSSTRKALPVLAIVVLAAAVVFALTLRQSKPDVPVFVPLGPSNAQTDGPGRDHVVVRGDWGYPPFEYLNESGEPDGFNVEIMTHIAEVMNLDIRIRLGPWEEVREELETGRIDALAGMYKTAARDRYVDFSIPHFIASYGVFVAAGTDIRSLEDIQDKRILVQEGDLGHDYLLDNSIGTEIVAVRDWKAVLPGLMDGKADCAVMGMVQGVRVLQEEGYDNVQVLSQPLVQRPYSIAVREGDAELLSLLNEGLNLLKVSGRYDAIYQEWFGILDGDQPLNSRLVRALAGGVLGLALVLIAIALWNHTLRRRVRNQTASLRSAMEELEEANATKDRFLAGVSHELRTPLHGILSMTELVEKSELDTGQRKLVGMLKSASQQLNRVLSDLIDISRLDAGKLSLHEIPFAIPELVEWIHPVVAEKAHVKGLEFSAAIQGDRHTVVVTDRERVAQIILNLADNAIKNTDSGSVCVTILTERPDGADQPCLQIRVTDTGRGIAQEDQERIFSAFTQLSSSSGELVSGLGLGLSIVRSITDLLGGSLDVRSAPGEGSTFSVRFPVRHMRSEDDAVPPENNKEPATPDALQVLLAEDEAINRLYLKQLLSEKGWTTTEVSDGEDAVFRVENHRYDLVFMDLSMPKIDGLEATRKIRRIESTAYRARTPIIALTAHAYEEHRQICLDAGMDGFVSKPFAENGFWQEVERVLERSASAQLD